MRTLGLYSTLLVLLIAAAATSLCLAYFDLYGRKAALWLSLFMTALLLFALSILGTVMPEFSSATSSPPPPGLTRVLWSALGSVALIHALPRFLLSAFGAAPRRALRVFLNAATAFVALLSTLRVITGWRDLAAVPAPIVVSLRLFMFVFIIGAFSIAIARQSQLPDRSLYRTIVRQLCALALLLPLILLEDLGRLQFPGFPDLGLLVLIAVASLSTIQHARASLTRPKYLEDELPSAYFVGHFGISRRELDVISAMLEGLSNGEIAQRLGISSRTVENHLYRVYQKSGIKNRLQLYNLLRSD